MAMAKIKADQLLCCVLITTTMLVSVSVSGIGAAPGGKGDRDQAPDDLIAVVKVGKKYYSNEPLTEDGRGVLYPVPDRLLGALGLPKPTASTSVKGSSGGGYVEGQEMKLHLSETRRQPGPGRGYGYKKPDNPLRYPDEPQDLPPTAPRLKQQEQIDSNELTDDGDLFSDGQLEKTITSTDKSAAAPLLNQHNIRAGANSGQRFVAKDIPTFDSILKGSGVVDDLREGEEFTGFQSRPSTKSGSTVNSQLGTQSQFFNANIRDLLYHRGKNGNGVEDGGDNRGPVATRAPIASAEFDQFALFVPSNEVQVNNRHLSSGSTPSTATAAAEREREPEREHERESPSTTVRFRPRPSPTTTSTSATTESDLYLDVRTIGSAADDDDIDSDAGADDDYQSLEVRAEQEKEEGYGFKKQTPRPRTRQRTRPAAATTMTEETAAPAGDTDNNLEQLESPVRTASEPEELKQIVTTITTTNHVPAGVGPAPAPTLHIAPTIDLTAQIVPTHPNDIMRQIYAPIQQQLPFIPMFDSIQPSVYLPFMQAPTPMAQFQLQQQQHLQPQPLLMQMLTPVHGHGGDEHAHAVREALFARQTQALQQHQLERPASIEDLYARGNGIVYGHNLANEAPINALRPQEYEFSRGAAPPREYIGESIRAETYATPGAGRSHHHAKAADFRLPVPPPKMEMFTPADAMTRRPPTPTVNVATTSREYPNTHY